MTPEERKVLEAQEALERAAWLKALRQSMSTKEGRWIWWVLFDDGNIFRTCMTGNGYTNYLLGKRDFMLPYYQDIMEACPNLWALTQQENFKPKGVKS